MQMDNLTEQAADKSLPHVVGDVVTTACDWPQGRDVFYKEPTSVELHRKHTNPWRCWVRGSVCPQHNPWTRRFDVIRVARGYVIATRCCVLQLCMRTACF